VDEFATKFLTLVRQGEITNEWAVALLESNTSPAIMQQVFMQGRRKAQMDLYIEEIRAIGRAQELYKMNFGGGWKGPFSGHQYTETGTQPGRGAPMEIGAVGRSMADCICYNCQEKGHMARGCKNAPRTRKEGPAPKKDGRQVRQVEGHQAGSLDGMTYEEAQAFFYDKQIAEMKAAGKEFAT
jgi:hypothetical protein